MATRKSFFIWRVRQAARLIGGGLAGVSSRLGATLPGMADIRPAARLTPGRRPGPPQRPNPTPLLQPRRSPVRQRSLGVSFPPCVMNAP